MKNPPLIAKIFTVLFSSSMVMIYVMVMVGGVFVGSIVLPGSKSGRLTPEQRAEEDRLEREYRAQQARDAHKAQASSPQVEPFRFFPGNSAIVHEESEGALHSSQGATKKPILLLPGSKSAIVVDSSATSYASDQGRSESVAWSTKPTTRPTTRPAKLIWGSKSGMCLTRGRLNWFCPSRRRTRRGRENEHRAGSADLDGSELPVPDAGVPPAGVGVSCERGAEVFQAGLVDGSVLLSRPVPAVGRGGVVGADAVWRMGWRRRAGGIQERGGIAADLAPGDRGGGAERFLCLLGTPASAPRGVPVALSLGAPQL